MNKSLLLVFFSVFTLLNCPFRAAAQADFAPIGAKWYYEWMSQWVNPVTSDISLTRGYMLQESVSDTVIQGITARKLQQTVFARNPANNSIFSNPHGNIYIHTTNDTVFYYHSVLNRFVPLYIFNVQIGDTIVHSTAPEYYSANDTIWKMKVDTVITESFNGQVVKSVHTTGVLGQGLALRGPHYQYFGQLEGRFAEYNWSYLPEDNYELFALRCYQDATFDVHFGNATIACDSIPLLPLSLNDRKELSQKLSVYPNPATDEVIIALDGVMMQSVEVIDVLGRRVLLQEYKAGTTHTKIDFAGINRGTYILSVNTKDKGSVHRKIVLK